MPDFTDPQKLVEFESRVWAWDTSGDFYLTASDSMGIMRL